MGLTGGGFVALVIAIALAAVVACVRLLPRCAGRVLARAGLLAGTQAVLLVTLLVVVNSAVGFYTSWKDLLGADTGAVRVFDHSSGPPAPTPSATPTQDALTRRLPAGQGRLDALTVRGTRSGISERVYVYVPTRYARRRLPVVLVLSAPRDMIVRRHLPGLVAGQIAAGRLRPALFVIAPTAPGCVDAPGARQGETFFTQDVPAAIASAYRSATSASGWSAMGDSTGGYCAVKLAMRHSDRYSAAVSLAGTYHALQDFTTKDLYGGSRPYRAENDLIWRLRHRPPPPVSLLLTTTRTGERDYAQTRLFLTLVRPPTHVASITLAVGGHHFSTWRRELPPALTWLGAHLR